MARSSRSRVWNLPAVLRQLNTDEYAPLPYTAAGLSAVRTVLAKSPERARRLNMSVPAYAASRLGTAAALRALNPHEGPEFYRVPPEAVMDQAAANEALGGNETVIDVQTHYVADRPATFPFQQALLGGVRAQLPASLQFLLDGIERYNLAEFLRCVFLESETAIAVLSSPPGVHEDRPLTNGEMAGTRELLERFGGNGRLLNHCVVHANVPGELEHLDAWRDTYKPVGWKVYTPGVLGKQGWAQGSSWMLDDEDGIRFLERVREVGVRIVCAHKGLGGGGASSPRDIGPVARAFPDIRFLVYHSGWEQIEGTADEGIYDPLGGGFIKIDADEAAEGPYSEEVAHLSTNRLVKTLKDSRIAPGSNVYAELGTTWFSLIKRPAEAAHVLGKLLLACGEDNVLWGTDSIWYGPTQPAVDAFRAFQIPQEYREAYGYPDLTPELKAKVLGRSAAKVYGFDLDRARATVENDDLAWARAALQEYRSKGLPVVQ